MANNPISIVIIDDHPVIRYGLTNILDKHDELSVTGEAKDAEEAISVVFKTKPDIIILDISLGDSDGIDLIESLKKASPQVGIIMYTMHFNKDLVAWSLKAGARGYMLKSDKTSELVQAVKDVFKGDIHLSSSIPSNILTEITLVCKDY